jgi:hypothetical protein
MTRMLRYLAVGGLTLLAAERLGAQGIDGTWITEFERMMRNEGGSVTTGEKVRAKMVLQRKGDSVTGIWQVAATEAAASAPRQLRGTIAGNKVALTTEFEATVNVNGERSTRKLTVVYDFTIDGDKLEGTVTNRSSDMDMPPRPFSAWRDKTG